MTAQVGQNGPYAATSKLMTFWPVGVAVVMVALGWQQMRSQILSEETFRKQAIAQVLTEVTRIADAYDKLEHRTRLVEEQGARTDERFTMILTLMTELKTQVSTLTEDMKQK